MNLRVFMLCGSFRPLGFAGNGGILLLGPGGEEHAGPHDRPGHDPAAARPVHPRPARHPRLIPVHCLVWRSWYRCDPGPAGGGDAPSLTGKTPAAGVSVAVTDSASFARGAGLFRAVASARPPAADQMSRRSRRPLTRCPGAAAQVDDLPGPARISADDMTCQAGWG
jgi:hypothetical protein